MTLKWKDKELQALEAAQMNLAAAEAELNAAFFERRAVIRSLVVGNLIREHSLLLGPPGTGKSMLTRTFAEVFAGGSYFEILMTKFTVPEEIFGPVSFSALKQDKHERSMAGYAPDMHVWFLDEIWKASSAILNALLKATNERIVRNGTAEVHIPLDSVVGASNEYPQDDSLMALFDRFLFKHWVDQIADDDNLKKLWANGGRPAAVTARMDQAELALLRKAICEMEFNGSQLATLQTIKSAVAAEGFIPSTRTWMKVLKIVKGSALASGRLDIIGTDFTVLTDVLWKEHKDRPTLQQVIGNAADPYGSRAEAIVDGVKTAMHSLPKLDELKTGQKTKAEIVKIIAEVSGQVNSERDKIEDVLSEAGKGNPGIEDARDIVEKAQNQVLELMHEVSFYREGKK